MTREKIIKSPAYWFEYEQNELFRQVNEYMQRENINRSELAKKLNVSKGYISQILNGNFNYTLKKLIDISLCIGVIPRIKYEKVASILKEDQIQRNLNKYCIQEKMDIVIPLSHKQTVKDERLKTVQS